MNLLSSKEEMFTHQVLRTVCILTIAVVTSILLMQELYLQDQSKVFIAFSNYTQSNPKAVNKNLDEILKPYLK